MRICVVGAGAIGGHLAFRLAQAGHEVSIIARGAHLAAIKARGLGFTTGGDVGFVPVVASDDPAAFGVQDAIIVALKATGLAAVPGMVGGMVGPRTIVLFLQNGMPWWYPVSAGALPHALPDLPVFRLAGPFMKVLEPHQIAAGTVYSGNEVREPGIVFNSSPGRNSVTVGAIDPAGEAASEALRAALDGAGVAASRPNDPRTTMWTKLVQNMSGSAIKLATFDGTAIAQQGPRISELFLRILDEGIAIAGAWGHRVEIDPKAALAQAPNHKPSLLQDYDHGRAMEIGEIVLAPAEFARAAGVPCPSLDAVAAIVARLAVQKGLFAE